MRDLIRGLDTGDGSGPVVKGVVWTIGIGQPTADLATYRRNLEGWLRPGLLERHEPVRPFWSQEVFGDVRDWAVPGTDIATRRDRLIDYLEHVSVLAGGARGERRNATRRGADAPLANAAWAWTSGFGYTLGPVTRWRRTSRRRCTPCATTRAVRRG